MAFCVEIILLYAHLKTQVQALLNRCSFNKHWKFNQSAGRLHTLNYRCSSLFYSECFSALINNHFFLSSASIAFLQGNRISRTLRAPLLFIKWFLPQSSGRSTWLSVSGIKVAITNTASRTIKEDLNFIFDVLVSSDFLSVKRLPKHGKTAVTTALGFYNVSPHTKLICQCCWFLPSQNDWRIDVTKELLATPRFICIRIEIHKQEIVK